MSVVPGARAAQRTWTGGGGDFNWGTPGNWGGTAPVSGDDVLFTGSTRLNNSNSIGGLKLNSLSYSSSGFTNVGQALTITNGIMDTAGNNTNLIALTLGAAQSFTNTAGGTPLVLNGAMATAGFPLTIGGDGNLFLGGVISGPGSLTMSGNGVLRLAGANTFSNASGLTINSGTVRLANAAAIPTGNGFGNVAIAFGATLDLGGNSQTINGLNGAGTVDEASTNAATYILTLGNGSSNGVFSGVIQNTFGTVALTKNGTGTQTLSGANAYIGPTTINGGTLALAAGGSLASTNIGIASGAVFDVSGAGGFSLSGLLRGGRASGFANDIIGSLSMSGGSLTIIPGVPGTLTINGNLTLANCAVNYDLNNVSTAGGGTNDLIALAGGNLDLSGGITTVRVNPFKGTLSGTYTLMSGSSSPVSGGPANLQVEAPRGITAAFDTTSQPNSVLMTASGTANPASLLWTGNGAGGPWDVQTSPNWLNGASPDVFYNLDFVTFDDSAGTANATVNLPVAVSPGSVTVSNSAVAYTFGVANSDPGLISGTGGLTKNGSGMLTLNAQNNYSGDTVVNMGALLLGTYNTGSFVNNVVLYNGVAPGTVVLGNGGLFMVDQANTFLTVTFAGFQLKPGGSSLAMRTRQSNSTTYSYQITNGVTRSVGSTLDINNLQTRSGSVVGVYITNVQAGVSGAVNGILGGYATLGLNDWVVPAFAGLGSGAYAAYQNNTTPSAWGTVSNVVLTANPSANINTASINSLKLTGPSALVINSGQTLTLTSGGLLVPNNAAGASSISGGTLMGAASADLVVLQNHPTLALTIGSVIADNGGTIALTKAGQGTLILTGANTYTGPTYINGSTLSGGSGTTPGTIAAGTLQLGSGGTVGSISSSSGVTNYGNLVFNRSDVVTFAAPVWGPGSLKNLGAGTTILTANNSYSAATTISAGALQVGAGGTAGSLGTSASVTDNGLLVFNRSDSVSYSGPISGTGGLTQQGASTLTLGGADTYQGNTTINAGVLSLGPTGSVANSAALVVAGGAAFDVSALGSYALVGGTVNQILAGSGTVRGSISTAPGTRLSPGTNGVYGTLTITNALVVSGGSLNLDVSTGSTDLLVVGGNLTLDSGTIVLNVSGTLPNGRYKLVQYGGSLRGAAVSGSVVNLPVNGFNQPGSIASLSSSVAGEIDLVISSYIPLNLVWQGDGGNNFWDIATTADWTNSAGAPSVFHQLDNATFDDTTANTMVNLQGPLTPTIATVNGSLNSYTFQGSGSLAGGGLTVNNPNTLTILTTNTFTGLTTVNAGTVQFGNGTVAGTPGGGDITNRGALVFNEPGDVAVSGSISGSGSLTLASATTLSLEGNSTFSGPTAINAGILQVGVGGLSGALGSGTVTDNGALVFNRSGTVTSSGPILGSGSVSNIGPGAVTLSGNNSYSGATVLANGTLKLGASEVIPDGAGMGNVELDGGATVAGTLDLNGFNETINGLAGAVGTVPGQVVNNGSGTNFLTLGNGDTGATFSGRILDNTGAGGKVALVKIGAGTQTLDIESVLGNAFSGGTIISNGVLRLASPTAGAANPYPGANSAALGTGPITFYGGTLSLVGAPAQSTSPTWFPGMGNTVIVPTNQTGTVIGCQRGPFNPTLLGSGTFNYQAAYVRGSIGGDWSQFTGQIIFSDSANGGQIGINSTTGFGRVFCTNSAAIAPAVVIYNTVAGTPTIPFGELADDGTSQIESFSSGNAGGVAANFAIGGLNTSTTFGGSIIDNVGITKVGTGTLTLTNATLSYTGPTTVSNGVLLLTAAIPASALWSLASPGVLDIGSNSVSTTLAIGATAAQVLQGSGTLRGGLALGPSGTLTVGFSNGIGTLTVTNAVDLSAGFAVTMELNRANPGATNDQLAAGVSITYGGTLSVSNIGPSLHAGDTFKLFSAPSLSGSFGVVNFPATDANGFAYTWADNLTTDGTITVLTAVNTTPTTITTSASGPTLSLSWPADHTGWRLQAQTNALNVGLTPNWATVPGSTATNRFFMPLNPANGSVFYRMAYP
jgi:autotransporter-associated beta strand protein